ncbi:MAG: GGDEF domain-containing protein [Gallionellaceae bacterium]|jgi:diguanylate cyclase (GGDEF)-like protein
MSYKNLSPAVTFAQSRIDALCVRALFERALMGAMLAPLAILFLCWVEKDVVGLNLAIAWLTLNIFPYVINFFLTSHLLRHPPADKQIPYWHNWELVIRTTQGLFWGSAAIFFHVEGENSFVNDLSVLVVQITVSAVTMVNLAPSLRTLAGFSSGILLIPAAYYFWLGDTQHMMFAFGLLILWVVELETGRNVNRQFAEGVRWGAVNEETSRQLESRNRELDELNRQLNTIAIHDKLTGIYNRHFVVEQLEMQHDLFQRYGSPCSLVMLDIDHFKQVNDVHGHAVGDHTLVAFSRCVEKSLRHGDVFARYGGEEFMLVLPVTYLEAALQFSDRIRSLIAGKPLLEYPVSLSITASFGVAQLKPGEAVEDWVSRADQALYKAKASGRNCVRE